MVDITRVIDDIERAEAAEFVEAAVPRNEKVCPTCGQTKSLDEFYKSRTRKSGVQTQCKTCHKAYYKKKWAEDEGFRERARDRMKIWHEEHKAETKAKRAAKRAAKKAAEAAAA